MLFIGDSITDCGRRAEHAPLGSGYVRMFGELGRPRGCPSAASTT